MTDDSEIARLRSEIARLRSERDFYARLLDLAGQDKAESLLGDALKLIVEVTGAHKGYIELYRDEDEEPWSMEHDCSDDEVRAIRSAISTGIIAVAMSSGKTIHTPSAMNDSRFRSRQSVREHNITAVLCAPVGTGLPLGVVYLQKHDAPGAFSDDDRRHAELFARQLAPLAERLLIRERQSRQSDATTQIRQGFHCPEIVGRSPALAQVLREAAAAASLDVRVYLTGPSGTGKTALARAIHQNSRRAGGPFIVQSCANLADNAVAESVLFGALRGSHSTAYERQRGVVEEAHDGTLFLDELSELPWEAQGRLLQFVQSGEYRPLGQSKMSRANVRIISASNSDLRAMVEARTFREDLYYRLNVIEIKLPPLSERRHDIALIAEHLLQRICQEHGLSRLELSPGALMGCEISEWPGNIRELYNALVRAAISVHSSHEHIIDRHHIFPGSDPAADRTLRFDDAVRRYKMSFLQEALDRNSWNISQTARELGLTRTYLHQLIHTLELHRRT